MSSIINKPLVSPITIWGNGKMNISGANELKYKQETAENVLQHESPKSNNKPLRLFYSNKLNRFMSQTSYMCRVS